MTSRGFPQGEAKNAARIWGRRVAVVLIAVLVAAALGVAAILTWYGAFDASPFREIPARAVGNGAETSTGKGYAAVLVSGDLGPRAGMGAPVAGLLAEHGVATVSVNSLNYFRVRRTPADVSALLGEAIRRAMALGHVDKVVVLGQSFGADMVHVGLQGLPADLRRHVSLVVLTVPTRTVFLRVSPLEWLDRTTPDAMAIVSARALDWVPVVCIRGREEPDSLCPLLHLPRLTQVALPGDHYLEHNADRLFMAIRDALAGHFHTAFPEHAP
ncbi:virulence protein VirJ [Novosphingobium sp. PhB165]|uniref:AcvB/VirJ family lysyl-phosphatidylglycerol hydrolase n=1 Tax=Novosphingobium sp. PhB165 TaxID=2485105 RepID=UPI0010E35499|nr:AcvB/VirJ family lysyl-phosphatidylglycerol hydrolase [Novosphingobium sp. PhB165]TCM19693.1 virulence protein VirJ [Novosphingobium sp. PhB165]